jgi:hypothetical protein
MSEPITLRIAAEPHNRIARVHEALRDLGLELCGKCHVWKGQEHIVWIGVDIAEPSHSFTLVSCDACLPFPLLPREAESGEGRGGGALPTELATAIREVAR